MTDFRFPKMGPQLLSARACKHHNALARAKAARLDDLYAEIQLLHPHSHPRVLERACVSYLHHLGERQQPLLTELRGDPAQFEAYAQLKARLLAAIAQQYPWLQAECERQALI
ncbi:MAG: hypothetical protein ACO1RX_02455 [Candidatus Sericytochromatia bacterium]